MQVHADCLSPEGESISCDMSDEELDFSSQEGIRDPFEPFNRAMFDVNYTLDTAFLHPIFQLYQHTIPTPLRQGVSSLVSTLSEPLNALQSFFQLKMKDAGISLGRFVINTVFGFFGTIDTASKLGLKKSYQDTGKTLGVMGMKPGPFLIVPVIGPSNFRDVIGRVGDIFLDPTNYFFRKYDRRSWVYWRYGATLLSGREAVAPHLQDIYQNSDPYTRMKILYMLRRASEINPKAALEQGPQFFDDEDEEF